MLRLASVSLLLLFVGSTFAQTTQPDPVAEHRAMLQAAEREFADLPKLAVSGPRELIRLTLVEGRIEAQVVPKIGAGDTRIIVPSLGGLVKLSLPHGSDGMFFLTQSEIAVNPPRIENTSIHRTFHSFNLARESETGTLFRSVQIIQAQPAMNADADPESVRLRVQITDQANEGANVNINFAAPTFADLRRQYPVEVEKYLGPIFSDYGCAVELLAPQSALAWQVLGGEASPDSAAEPRVREILKRLDDANFRTRDQAMAELKSLDAPAASWLARIDRSTLTPQQAIAVQGVVANRNPVEPQQAELLAKDPDFLASILYLPEPALRTAALKQLSQLAGKSIAWDEKLAAEKPYEAVSAVRAQITMQPTTQGGPPAREMGP